MCCQKKLDSTLYPSATSATRASGSRSSRGGLKVHQGWLIVHPGGASFPIALLCYFHPYKSQLVKMLWLGAACWPLGVAPYWENEPGIRSAHAEFLSAGE